MIRVVFCLILCVCFSYAYFVVEDDYERQVEVLKNLDIDITFLQDNVFASMKEEISLYKQKQFLKMLENGTQFIPILKNMIQEADIPEAFLYMAMAESGFSAKAYSKAKASGLWQFMSETAKIYGLTVDDYVDERRDPIKSTEAAIEYLKALHNRFGKWYLAAMAYNCGEGRVARAIEQAGTDNLYNLLDEKKKYLPKETREYIRKIVVMAYLSEDKNFLFENDADHFLNNGRFESAFVKKELRGGLSMFDVAETLDMSLNELWAYNPHLKYFFTPPNKKKYHIYIPHDKEKLYERDFDASKISSRFDVYTVTKGDSFYKIAQKYKVNYKIIKDFNSITSNTLKAGQKLIIPVMQTSSSMPKYYIIKNGDTLFSISSKYNLSVAQLKKVNKLKDEIIYPGSTLEIPDK
ncbi:MAG: LysM peptidoglycan-binding domain-containing protein [Campylobacteraceae bacterium]|jgi:membrane-bound lytic murein transglycosylase D|nr:LysM peptidoglycan-binding domain-containing protein [Campylobacteraceae bacterium]